MLKKLLTILLLCALPLTGAMGEIVSLSADGAPGLRYDYDRYATENGYEDPSISVTIYNGQMEETKYIYALVKIAHLISCARRWPIRSIPAARISLRSSRRETMRCWR